MTEFQLEKVCDIKKNNCHSCEKVGEMVDFYKKVMGFCFKVRRKITCLSGVHVKRGTQLLILEETRKSRRFS